MVSKLKSSPRSPAMGDGTGTRAAPPRPPACPSKMFVRSAADREGKEMGEGRKEVERRLFIPPGRESESKEERQRKEVGSKCERGDPTNLNQGCGVRGWLGHVEVVRFVHLVTKLTDFPAMSTPSPATKAWRALPHLNNRIASRNRSNARVFESGARCFLTGFYPEILPASD